ncbi:hypothetical protein MRX96_055188 [Rhipicephalus microplus]
MARASVGSSYTTRLRPDLRFFFDARPDHLTMKIVAPSKNLGVLEAVNASGNTSRKCSFRNTSRASDRSLRSDEVSDAPMRVSWSGPSIRRDLALRAQRLENVECRGLTLRTQRFENGC